MAIYINTNSMNNGTLFNNMNHQQLVETLNSKQTINTKLNAHVSSLLGELSEQSNTENTGSTNSAENTDSNQAIAYIQQFTTESTNNGISLGTTYSKFDVTYQKYLDELETETTLEETKYSRFDFNYQNTGTPIDGTNYSNLVSEADENNNDNYLNMNTGNVNDILQDINCTLPISFEELSDVSRENGINVDNNPQIQATEASSTNQSVLNLLK